MRVILSLFTLVFSFCCAAENITYPSMEQIAQEVVLAKRPSEEQLLSVAGDATATRTALDLLECYFSHEHLDGIERFSRGEQDVRDLGIVRSNARAFLSAAKWYDLTHLDQQPVTFAVRLQCMHRSEGDIVSLDAMSHSVDPRLVIHEKTYIWTPEFWEIVMQATAYVPEWTVVQRDVLAETYHAIVQLSDRLDCPTPTQLIIRGNSGAGKTYTSSRHPLLHGVIENDPGPYSGIQNTDSIKRILSERYFMNNWQSHSNGVCLRKALRNMIAAHAPELNLVTDGWFNRTEDLDLVTHSVEEIGGALQIIDLDVSLATSCLRVIERASHDTFAPLPPFNAVAAAYQQIRAARVHLIDQIVKVRDVVTDYQLFVDDEEGEKRLVAEKTNGFFHLLPGAETLYERARQHADLDEEVAAVAAHVIDTSDVSRYGDGLIPFIGTTITDAMSQLAERPLTIWNPSALFASDTHSHLHDREHDLHRNGGGRAFAAHPQKNQRTVHPWCKQTHSQPVSVMNNR